ncbi:LytTR family DNA-binding domain-containing protein [Pseudoflavonifractor phocaeensis]|uniref:LytR/AlgR family response regulator transcription factor n=1 Tax=Pseudoflavonifractor phocaeensis TaxID=1870988 RepID=UPI00313CB624
MSVRIAVCEDCARDAEVLRGQMERYCREYGLPPFAVDVFSTGSAFSERCVPGVYDLVFMDIYLEHEDGMRVVRELRRLDQDCPIVFFTRSADHMLEAFEVNAAHYLTKPLAYPKLAQALDRCLRLCEKRSKFILLRTERALRRVLLSEIVFAEVFGNISVVHLKREDIHVRMTLKDLEREIEQAGGGAGFLRCHRSVLVNMDHITALRDSVFLMDTGLPVPISKYSRKQVIRAYEAFALQTMRDTHAVGAGI